MLNLVFLSIILYIIIQHLMDDLNEGSNQMSQSGVPEIKELIIQPHNSSNVTPEPLTKSGMIEQIAIPKIITDARLAQGKQEPFANTQGNEVINFNKPHPWSKIIIVRGDDYPFKFHIKLKIPSLNDFEQWKQIIPNLSFDPRPGELIIPSKDEASALALANLISINFLGQMSLANILDKNLIQISVGKAKGYEVVQNKLREQIMENLHGKQTVPESSWEQDLAQRDNRKTQPNPTKTPDLNSESFTDTFEQYSGKSNDSNDEIEAYDGSDFSYF
jgi:hypothetical protein